MNNLNSILLEGHLVRDPDFRITAKGTPLCTFALASNRYFKQDAELEKEVSYFNVETWAKLAESVKQLGHKGRGVRVVGRLKQERWQNAEGYKAAGDLGLYGYSLIRAGELYAQYLTIDTYVFNIDYGDYSIPPSEDAKDWWAIAVDFHY
jgi:hypothetical protein